MPDPQQRVFASHKQACVPVLVQGFLLLEAAIKVAWLWLEKYIDKEVC